MTALTDREFIAELDLYADCAMCGQDGGEYSDDTPTGLPATHVQGECDTCGTDGTIRITPEGLACEDCYDADPQPYDYGDCYERADDGWGW